VKWSQAREYSVDVFSALRNLLLPCPEPLTFIHLPKCAGTSLRRALARCYRVPTSRRIENVPLNQVIRAALSGPRVNFNLEERLQVWDTAERIGLYAMLSGAPLVMGHLPFNRHRYKAVLHKRKFITVLRDPVERWISNYRNSQLVGFVERMPAFLEQLRKQFGLPIGTVPRYNASIEHSETMFEITEAQRQRISELCSPDLELYAFARHLKQAAL